MKLIVSVNKTKKLQSAHTNILQIFNYYNNEMNNIDIMYDLTRHLSVDTRLAIHCVFLYLH
jgi:hypothetical protein